MYLPNEKRTTVYTKAVFDMETGELLHREPFCTWFGALDLCEGTDDGGTQDTPDPGVESTDSGEATQDYFLTVDDRTRYRTIEEAQEGYRNAGQQIAELTPWKQIAGEYGLSDPNDVASLLDELAELRAAQNANSTQKRGDAGTGTTAPVVTTASKLDPESPEGKQASAIAWLQKNGVDAGLVNKDQLTELTERLDYLTSEAQRVEDERFQGRMEYGRNVLNSELKAAGLFPSDPKDVKGQEAVQNLSSFLEDALTTWVNGDQRRVQAFYAGGEQLSTLIKTGLQRILPTLNILRSSSGATYSATKGANANRGSKVASVPVTGKPVMKSRSTGSLKPEDGITPEVHELAWKALQEARGNQA